MANYANSIVWDDLNLNYEGENKFASFFASSGNIHTYPAKAVPEMVSDLLKKIMSIHPIHKVLDPFVGSGTTALEAKYLGLDFYGSDLNPLAILLAKTKSLTIEDTNYTKNRLNKFVEKIKNEYTNTQLIPVVKFEGLNFWFKEENVRELEYLKFKINDFIKNANKINREMYALILLTAFSSTIRRVSLTRNSEFKLYRMSPNDVDKYSINALKEFEDAIKNLMTMLVEANNSYKRRTKSNIYLKNAKNLDYLEDKSVDLVITSPPYGDSKTTVAYGEFSKLSLQWTEDLLKKYLGISIENSNCDELLLGGRKSKWNLEDEEDFYASNKLKRLINSMDDRITEKQAELDVAKMLLYNMKEKIAKGKLLLEEELVQNSMLFHLICERIRLDIYRKINKSLSGMNDREIKKLTKEKMEIYVNELTNCHSKKYFLRQKALETKLDKVLETLDRNDKSILKRKDEVLIFMKDLYRVVTETDRVLKDDGFQVWIVGHRTVMGKIVVNMEGIIRDWFINMGYECEASLNRKYSFKRMPHHINSTIERCEEVSTMMNEYILVVKKKSMQ